MNEELLLGLYNTYGLSQFGNFEDFKKDMSSPDIQKGIFETYGLSKYGNFQSFQKDLGFVQTPQQGGVDYMNKAAASGFETPAPITQQNVSDVLGTVNRTAGELVTLPLQTAGALQAGIGDLVGMPIPEEENVLYQLGKQGQEAVESINPVSQEFQESLGGQITKGLSQGVGMIGTAGLSAGRTVAGVAQPLLKQGLAAAAGRGAGQLAQNLVSPVGVIGSSMVAAPEWEAAKQAGLSDEEALGTLVKNYFVGSTEVLPIQNMLGRFAKMTGRSLADIGRAMVSGGFEEFLQEGTQTYLTNMIARGDYDPDRDPLFQVLESAKVGGIVGMILPGMVGAISSASPQVKQRVQEKIDQLEINKLAEEFKTDTEADTEINQIVDEVEKAIIPHSRVTYPTMDEVPVELQEYATEYPTGVVVNAPTDLIEKVTKVAVQEVGQPVQPNVQPQAVDQPVDALPVDESRQIVSTNPIEPIEGSVTELPALFAGGMPRKMTFTNGTWKQNVGGELTYVSPKVQQQAGEAFGVGQPIQSPIEQVVEQAVTEIEQPSQPVEQIVEVPVQPEPVTQPKVEQTPVAEDVTATPPVEVKPKVKGDIKAAMVAPKASVRTVLKAISESDSEYSSVAKQFLKILDTLSLDVEVTNDPNSKATKFAGQYVLADDQVLLNDSIGDKSRVKTFIHETVHAATVRKLASIIGINYIATGENEELTEKSEETIQSYLEEGTDENVKNLIRAFNKARESFPTNKDRGLLNLDEFLAEAFSNPKFQAMLNEIPFSANKSVWKKLIEAVGKMLGFDVKSQSLLESVLKGGAEVMNKKRNEKLEKILGDFSKSGKKVLTGESSEYLRNMGERQKTRAKRRGVKPTVKTEKQPTKVKPTVVTTPQVDTITQEKLIDEEVARLNKQAEKEESKTVYNRGVDAKGDPIMFEKTKRADGSLKLVGKKTYEQIVNDKALQSKPSLTLGEAEILADEFNKSGVILTPSKVDAQSGTNTDDSRQENAEKVADFLRNKGVTTEEDVADFAEAWNNLGIQGARVINKADIKAVTSLLTSKKGKPFNNETITATINEVIKNITNHFIKGKTLGVRKGQQLVNRELENLQEILKNSNLNRQQVSAILTRLRKVSFFTPTGVEKLRGFINDVVNDAEFVDKIRTARALRSKVRKLGRTKSKTISAEIRKFAKQFGTIPVTEFEEKDKIDSYIKNAEMIVNGTKPITSPNYAPVDLGEISKFVKEAYDKQQREYLRLLNGDLTDTEIEALINDPTELERIMKGKDVSEKETRDDILMRAKYAEIALRDVVGSLTGNQKKIVEYLIQSDKTTVPTATLMQFVRIADNIVTNKDFSGVLPMVAQIKSPEIIEALKKSAKKYKTSFGKMSGALLRSTQSVDNMLNAIFNNRRFIAEFMSQTGLQGVFEAGSQTERQVEDLRERVDKKLKEIDKKYKTDINDRKEGLKLAMLAELAKHYDEAGVTHLKSVKTNITESIRQWAKAEPEMAKVAQKTFDDFANVKSADEAIEIAKAKYPHIYETWKFFVDEVFTEQFSNKAGANTQMVYNTPFLQMKNYLPTTFETVDTTKAGDPETGRDAQKQSVLSTAPKQSPYTLEATRGLQPGKAYNSNYIVGLINAYKKTLYDINSAESLLTANAVLNNPDFESLIGGLDNKNKLNKDLEEMFSFQRGVTGGNSEIEREFNEVTAIFREAATGLALGGFDQAPLQFIPGYIAALENLGPQHIKHAGHFSPPTSFVEGVFKKSRTGVRSLRRGGTDIGDVNQLVFTPERRKSLERALTKTLKVTRGAASIALQPLTWSDSNLARATWTAYYIKSLRDQGVKESEINLSKEAEKQGDQNREIARAYADSMVSSTQAPSNQAEMSKLARSRGAAGVLRNLLFSFSVFPANFKWRFMQAASKIRHNPREGSVELGSVLTELAVYALMKDYILSFYYDALKDLWRSLFDVEEPEKDEEQKTKEKERMFGRMTTRVLNDLAPWTLGVGSKLSDITIKPLVDSLYYSSMVNQKEYPTYKEWLDETGGFASKSFESDFSDYGLFGILPDKLMRSYDAIEASYNTHRGDETIFYNTPYGEAESDVMGPAMQKMIDIQAGVEGVTNFLPFPREFRSTMRQVYREQLKESTPENRENKNKRRERRLQLTPR